MEGRPDDTPESDFPINDAALEEQGLPDIVDPFN